MLECILHMSPGFDAGITWSPKNHWCGHQIKRNQKLKYRYLQLVLCVCFTWISSFSLPRNALCCNWNLSFPCMLELFTAYLFFLFLNFIIQHGQEILVPQAPLVSLIIFIPTLMFWFCCPVSLFLVIVIYHGYGFQIREGVRRRNVMYELWIW